MFRRCETIQRVVLPAWVPPDTSALRTLRTGSSRNRAAWSSRARPDRLDETRTTNLRMFTDRNGGDIGNDHMKPAAVGLHGVDWRRLASTGLDWRRRKGHGGRPCGRRTSA
jgi:hypothetical protein